MCWPDVVRVVLTLFYRRASTLICLFGLEIVWGGSARERIAPARQQAPLGAFASSSSSGRF